MAFSLVTRPIERVSKREPGKQCSATATTGVVLPLRKWECEKVYCQPVSHSVRLRSQTTRPGESLREFAEGLSVSLVRPSWCDYGVRRSSIRCLDAFSTSTKLNFVILPKLREGCVCAWTPTSQVSPQHIQLFTTLCASIRLVSCRPLCSHFFYAVYIHQSETQITPPCTLFN